MRRITESLIQAALVMGVIILSPYAMLAGRGCPTAPGGPGRGATIDAPAEAPVEVPQKPDAVAKVIALEHQEASSQSMNQGALPGMAQSPSYECLVPDVQIMKSQGCTKSQAYPSCRWQLPTAKSTQGLLAVWKHTTPDHRWGSPALVALVLATAHEFSRLHAGTTLTVGDLDAPCDRHVTHRKGLDVDLYLPGVMAADNAGGGGWTDNYEGLEPAAVEERRRVVLSLAKILATCSGGKLRIYYNDAPTQESFLEWFGAQALATSFASPMEPHNDLHRFHFHVSIDPSIPILPPRESI